MTIFLIGARASGKTTVGRMLADRLGWPFADLDALLLEELGETIENFVEKNGWPAFRERESACLKKACETAGENLVLATGGGVPLARINQDMMRAAGHVVWLNTPPLHMTRRLLADPLQSQRPSLTGKPLEEEVQIIARERGPVYRTCCHLEVNGALEAEDVCGIILGGLKIQQD